MWSLGPGWRDEAALAAAWREAQPFPHLVFDDVVPATPVLDVLDDEAVVRQEGDIFCFEASGDLHELSASFGAVLAPPLARITGKPVTRAELRAYAYRPGHYLLPHSDHQDGLERLLAFAYYLPSPEPLTGGELELYRQTPERIDSALLISPEANRLVVFDVSDVSLHQVREVLAGLRLSLAGWFYP
ncbi:MAG: 2OG-Fe(II) oxygenase [Deltaproteobacteria bacterium]|nr:2OG-Fe(II) oxygenase [Deltaproteobacteria bacterium]